MANHLYQFLHPTSASIGIETALFTPSLNLTTPSIIGDIFGNNPPSADNVTPDADEMLSTAPDLVVRPLFGEYWFLIQ